MIIFVCFEHGRGLSSCQKYHSILWVHRIIRSWLIWGQMMEIMSCIQLRLRLRINNISNRKSYLWYITLNLKVQKVHLLKNSKYNWIRIVFYDSQKPLQQVAEALKLILQSVHLNIQKSKTITCNKHFNHSLHSNQTQQSNLSKINLNKYHI